MVSIFVFSCALLNLKCLLVYVLELLIIFLQFHYRWTLSELLVWRVTPSSCIFIRKHLYILAVNHEGVNDFILFFWGSSNMTWYELALYSLFTARIVLWYVNRRYIVVSYIRLPNLLMPTNKHNSLVISSQCLLLLGLCLLLLRILTLHSMLSLCQRSCWKRLVRE